MTKRYSRGSGKKRNNQNLSSSHKRIPPKLAFLLWFVPLGLAGFLFYNSPNIINEIKDKKEIHIKKEKIKNILDSMKHEIKSGKAESSIEKNLSESRWEEITLFFCELTNTHAKLVPLKTNISIDQEKIPQIIEKLINKPFHLSEKYQTLIPQESKLLSYYIDNRLLILNFNDQFLNNYYGNVGKKLKIAQIISTMTLLTGIDKVIFKVNNENIKYLDHDGIVSNHPLGAEDINLRIILN